MKTLRIFLLILIVIGITLILTKNIWVPKLVNKIISKESIQVENTTPTLVPILITDKKINEENFSGETSIISGTNLLAVKMQKYINTTISDFRNQANKEVPDIKKNFAENTASSAYEIDINSKYIKGTKTESIVTSVYSFTGGAHGSTIYKVITVSLSDGKILPLAKIIKKEKQNDFTLFVKRKLSEWIPEGSDALVAFAENISDLKFASFSNWALDGENLIIYFNQYAIGPGALGATEFLIPLKDIKDLINPI